MDSDDQEWQMVCGSARARERKVSKGLKQRLTVSADVSVDADTSLEGFGSNTDEKAAQVLTRADRQQAALKLKASKDLIRKLNGRLKALTSMASNPSVSGDSNQAMKNRMALMKTVEEVQKLLTQEKAKKDGLSRDFKDAAFHVLQSQFRHASPIKFETRDTSSSKILTARSRSKSMSAIYEGQSESRTRKTSP